MERNVGISGEITRFEVAAKEDRDKLVSALTNSGYGVRIIEMDDPSELTDNYWVVVYE